MTKSIKVVVLGSSGMLGHQVVRHLRSFNNFDVFDISRKMRLSPKTIILDVMDTKTFNDKIYQIDPDFIINCIGILVEGSRNIALSTYINSYFPHYLKDMCKKINSKLIHVSTDCVFSGDHGKYKEDDIRDGKDTYAKTKILGEVIDDSNVTIRTSIIGPELKESGGEGLFDWFIRQNESVNGFTNSIWSGVTTLELAKAIKWVIDENVVGLYHITNNYSISKYQMLKLFKKYTNKGIEIKPFDNKRIDKSFIDTRNLINYKIPSYDSMIEKMILDIKTSDIPYPKQYQFICQIKN